MSLNSACKDPKNLKPALKHHDGMHIAPISPGNFLFTTCPYFNVDQSTDITMKMITIIAAGKIGDGKILVSPLEQVIRIRTGETGNTAL